MPTQSKNLIGWNKTDIAVMLGVSPKKVETMLSQSLKDKIGWTKGKQIFRQIEVYELVKDLFPMFEQERILNLIHNIKA